MRYSVQPRDRIFVKRYGFLSFGKNMGKYWSGKYSWKHLDHAQQSATDALKTSSKRVIQKTAKATGNLDLDKSARANQVIRYTRSTR